MGRITFTDAAIRALPSPATANRIDYAKDDVRGFAIQTTYVGAKRFLLVYVAKASGRERRLVLGEFGPAPRLSVAAARRLAGQKRAQVDLGQDPWLEQKSLRAAAEARQAAANATYGQMLAAYSEHLRLAKKPSAKEVARELRATIEVPFPRLWRMPAIEVTLDHLVAVLARLTRAEKWRQAEKTRSYLRAAHTAAASARGKASASELFAAFSAVPNVARDLATIERPRIDEDIGVGPGKRALDVDELRAYWHRIRALQGPTGALLRAHLLTGAQRCAQLSRLTRRSLNGSAVTLIDPKGRRMKARTHVVPLLPDAAKAFADMRGGNGDYVFTLDGGRSPAGFHVVRRKVMQVADAMLEAGEIDRPFTPGELRITVETRLAAIGIPMEVRAQLQSHGLGGVQYKHYDKHDYFAEKLHALQALFGIIEVDIAAGQRRQPRAA